MDVENGGTGESQKLNQGKAKPAANKLGAYLNEFEAIVPDASHNPNFLMATDVRDALMLNGWVRPPD